MRRSRKETWNTLQGLLTKNSHTRDHRFTSISIYFMYLGLTESAYRGRDHSKDAKTVKKGHFYTKQKSRIKGEKKLQNPVISVNLLGSRTQRLKLYSQKRQRSSGICSLSIRFHSSNKIYTTHKSGSAKRKTK